jgi:hypothetical protein
MRAHKLFNHPKKTEKKPRKSPMFVPPDDEEVVMEHPSIADNIDEDDDFDESPVKLWDVRRQDQEEINMWEEDWMNPDPEFDKQLRAEN